MTNKLTNLTGSCLCGTIKYSVDGELAAFHMCHCTRCRKSTGTAHCANLFTSPENIQWLEGRESIKRFELPNAKSFSKQFCEHCGSPVPYVNRAGKFLVIPAGSLEHDLGVIPQDNIFWDSRADWYEQGRDSKKCPNGPE